MIVLFDEAGIELKNRAWGARGLAHGTWQNIAADFAISLERKVEALTFGKCGRECYGFEAIIASPSEANFKKDLLPAID